MREIDRLFDELAGCWPLNTDSYKVGMHLQYPPETKTVYSYIESRGGRWDQVMFFGLQAFLRKYLSRPVTTADVDAADIFWAFHGEPFKRELWDYIVKEHNGMLPVSVKAVREGTLVPTNEALVTIQNTDPACYWLPTWVETAILRGTWYPVTVATLSWKVREIIWKYHELTSDLTPVKDPLEFFSDPAKFAPNLFKHHDFGARGVSSLESAMLGGMAHLVSSLGTDTAFGALATQLFYGPETFEADCTLASLFDGIGKIAGFSIPAMEHSTVTAWGKENEPKAFLNMIQKNQGSPLIACVSDSYDLLNAVHEIWGKELKETVKTCGSTIVVRPDSGNPITIPVLTIEGLMEKFGYTTNSKGFKVLPICIRTLQGDGINERSVDDIGAALVNRRISIDNIAFGMGGALLQHHDRDTLKFAMKCSAIENTANIWSDVFKDPVTDPGKKSKRGRMMLINTGDRLKTIPYDPALQSQDQLESVFLNGAVTRHQTFSEVRSLAASF